MQFRTTYPKADPVSFGRRMIGYPFHVAMTLAFVVMWRFYNERFLQYRLTVNHPKASLIDRAITYLGPNYGYVKINRIVDAMSQDEIAAYIKKGWHDDRGDFEFFDDYAASGARGEHVTAETIRSEGLASVARHHLPIFQAFDKFLPKNLDVVEYGCGDCRNYAYTKDVMGAGKFIGYDISRAGIARAKELYPENADNFVYISSLDDVWSSAPRARPASVAILCYVLIYLTKAEQRRLIEYCLQTHEYVLILESLYPDMIAAQTENLEDLNKRHINYFKIAASVGSTIDTLTYHPKVLSLTNEPFLKPTNCAMMAIFKRKS